jgi:Xaa-Pro dipeptidase
MLPAPPAPETPFAELRNRLAAVRGEMARDNIDMPILTGQKNIEYFTGYRTLTWAYNARPLFCFIDEHALHVVASRIESRNLESAPRDFFCIFYDGYLAEGAQALLDEITRRDRRGALNVAIDYGQDMFGRGCVEIVQGLAAQVPGTGLKSGADALWRTRMIKSPFEASLKRTSFEIVNAAFDEAIAGAWQGMTEADLCRRVQAGIMENGADRADPIAMVFSRGEFVYSRPPSLRTLLPGHYVWTDFRSTYGGYPADRNRIARAGPPEDWEINAYSKVRDVTIALAGGVTPGISTGDLFRSFERLWSDAGLPPAYGVVSRIGHGGGLDVTEPPSICRDGSETIEPGMILHLEPKLEHRGAVFQFEEVIHVGEKGVTFLSDLSPAEIPVIH